jgi:3-phosphoshikimate 1-carboxyvinyltransferase
MAEGRTEITGFLDSADCEGTLRAFLSMGVRLQRLSTHHLILESPGLAGLSEPDDVLDFGNSGTAVRLMTGLLSGAPGFRILTGDQSLRSRPMRRVTEPLSRMGASIDGPGDGSRLPLAVRGRILAPITYENIHRSAQVKSAVLLAGLSSGGATTVIESVPTRDHTERLLPRFGGKIESKDGRITVWPGPLRGSEVPVPGDFSSAAFFIALALVTPGSRLALSNVGLNPTRTAFLEILRLMGASLSIDCSGPLEAGEPTGTIVSSFRELSGCSVPLSLIPSAIDEIPILAVLATFARGKTEIRGAGELRVKESDRITAIVSALKTVGITVEEYPDGLTIHGQGPSPRFLSGTVDSLHDHRIAMAMAILGTRLPKGETLLIEGTDFVETSFPGFPALLNTVAHP